MSRVFEHNVFFYGLANESVGIGQLKAPAARVALKYYPDERAGDLNDEDLRIRLAWDDELTIKLAAAYMYARKVEYDLTDEQAFTAYAGSRESINAWLSGSGDRQVYPEIFERAAGFDDRLAQACTLW